MKKLIYTFAFVLIVHCTLNIDNCSAQWVQMSNGIGTTQSVNSLAVLGNNIFAGTVNGVYISTNSGTNWAQTALNNQVVLSLLILGNNIFAGTYNYSNPSGVYLSTNNGTNWTQTALNNQQVISLATNGNNIFAGTDGNGVYRSTNNGSTWTQTALNNQYIRSLATSGNNIFAGASSTGSSTGSVYLSTNNGTNWTQTALNNQYIYSLATSGNNNFAGTANGVYLTTNNGTSWTQTALNNKTVLSLVTLGNIIFAGTNNYPSGSGGVYLSINNGTTWIEINQGFTVLPMVMAVLIANNYIFAGTQSYSVWRRELSDLVILNPPVLFSPLNNSVGNQINLNLVWTKSADATGYHVQLATDSLFNNIVINDSLLTDSIKILSNLNPLTYYWWRVKAKNIVGASNFSSVWKFKTVGSPSQVLLSTPVNNSTGQPVNLSFKWFKAVDQVFKLLTSNLNKGNDNDGPNTVSNYWFELATDSSFTNIITRDSTLTDTTKSVTSLLYVTNYFWRVKAKNQIGWAAFSSVWKFTTMIQIPTLVSPLNNSVNITLSPLLDWNDVVGANSYNLQVSIDSGFTTTVVNLSGLTNSQYLIPSGILQASIKYYWRTSASTSNGTGGWSDVWNFTTLAVPSAPALISPTNGSNILTTTPTLDWGDVTLAVSYSVQVATDTNFVNLIVNQSGLTTSQYIIPSGTLTGNTTYYWRARSVNEAGPGPWSVRWYFRVVTIPPAPNLVAPLNNSTNQLPTVLLDWDSLAATNSYRIQLATDSLFNSTIYDTSSITRSYLQMRPGILLAGVKYFWRVNATNMAGTGSWSAIWNFRVNPTGVNQYSSEIPKEFKLYNNFPNPFNPVTKIRFDVPKYSFIKISVFDISGKVINQPINNYFQAGSYEFSWYTNNLSSGVYFYRIEAENFTDVKRMLLVK